MYITAKEAMWFLPFVLPIMLWVSYTDLKYMKIRNNAVMALAGVFVIVGFIVLPLPDLAWRFSQLVVVLVITFLMSIAGLIGAGDAKLAAAMAPYFVVYDGVWIMLNFALILILSFTFHRLIRRIPAVKHATPDWASWEHKQFPMGLALSVLLVVYLIKGALTGAA